MQLKLKVLEIVRENKGITVTGIIAILKRSKLDSTISRSISVGRIGQILKQLYQSKLIEKKKVYCPRNRSLWSSSISIDPISKHIPAYHPFTE